MNLNKKERIWENKLLGKLEMELRDHITLYTIAKCLRKWHTEEFKRLIYGYYVGSEDYTTLLIERRGERYPDVVVLYFVIAPLSFSKGIEKRTTGFFALFRHVLQALNAAECLGCVPVVEIGANCMYYDPGMDRITKNVFEYYFEPVSDIRYTDVNSCSKVIAFDAKQASFFMKHASVLASESYQIEDYEIKRLGEIYKKCIRLNADTERYIRQNIIACLKERRTLGVHIRGTDYHIQIEGHPRLISITEYLLKAKEIFSSGKYEQIFLATDDSNALETFRKEFGSKLVFYTDTFRSSDDTSVHMKNDNRPLHHYKLGLEVLRDVYTLADCDRMICGLSQVAFAARYIRCSMGKEDRECVIMNNGIIEKIGGVIRDLNCRPTAQILAVAA